LTVLDKISVPGRPDKANDDAMGAAGSVAFVLDGATGLGDTPLLPGESDAAWVANFAAAALAAHAPGLAGDLDSLAFKAMSDVKAAFESQRLRETFARYEIPWATLAICGVTRGTFHTGFLGDSRILVRDASGAVHHFGAPLKYRKYERSLASSMIAQAKGAQIGIESIRATVLPQLRAARERVNTPEGYWLLGPDPRAAAHVVRSSMELLEPIFALLMTDGFYALTEDYRLYSDIGLVEAAIGKGLAALCGELRDVEEDDPSGLKYPRMKKSDDATAILLRADP
jgi:hypothetical protein